MKKAVGVMVLLVFGLFMVFGVPAFAADTIKIGVIGPMNFVQGQGHWNGATLAMEVINAKGGIQVGNKKMKIELIKADSNEHLSIPDATNAMERLMTRDKVDFVVGGFRTEAVLPMQDIACEYKKIFIGCGAATDAICTRVAEDYDTYKYWFRMTPFNGTNLAKASIAHLMSTAGAMKQAGLNIPKFKVAAAIEQAQWADGFVGLAKAYIPKLGMDLTGVWRPSANATDVTAELTAIQRSGAHIIYAIFSGPVGIPFARQTGELKIPAIQMGINVEAQKDDFWEATQGMGNYVMTSNTYARDVEQNENTKAFVDAYVKRFGETPTYTAGTYDAILFALAPSIEEAGTLNSDKIVSILENRVFKNTTSTIKYVKDSEGRHLHDIQFGPGYSTGLATQWQDGKLKGVWPYKWVAAQGAPEVTYKGIVPIKIPPWVIEAYK
ncbi:MAG: ABC transporter substrate-binding protein [Deltaproteobacteria bacterium]|nr:ABC transporter substrate-binding protein [Deltaproteobacteria bacterium]